MGFEKDGILQVSATELKQLLQDGRTKVIDVRTEEEYAEGHIPNIPLRTMQEVADWMDTLNADESYVFVCRSGNRSQKVAQFFKQQGFEHVANFQGGMLGWDGEIVTD